MCTAELCLPIRPFGYALSCRVVMQDTTLIKALGEDRCVEFVTAVPSRKVFRGGEQVAFAAIARGMGQHEIVAQIERVADQGMK